MVYGFYLISESKEIMLGNILNYEFKRITEISIKDY
jgi:hypothetical protein